MSAQALLRPQSAGSAVLTSGSAVNTGGIGVDGTIIFMKVQTAQFNITTKVQDTTGDGDTFANYDHDNELRGKISFKGFMLADAHVGIENLVVIPSGSGTSDKNPVYVNMLLGTGSAARRYKFRLAISNIVVDWNRVGGLIGVAVTGFLTGQFSSSVANALDEA